MDVIQYDSKENEALLRGYIRIKIQYNVEKLYFYLCYLVETTLTRYEYDALFNFAGDVLTRYAETKDVTVLSRMMNGAMFDTFKFEPADPQPPKRGSRYDEYEAGVFAGYTYTDSPDCAIHGTYGEHFEFYEVRGDE